MIAPAAGGRSTAQQLTDGIRLNAINDMTIAVIAHRNTDPEDRRGDIIYIAMRAIAWWRLGHLVAAVTGSRWPAPRIH